MAQYMYDVIDPEDRDRLHDNLLVGPSKLPMEVCIIRCSAEVIFKLLQLILELMMIYGFHFLSPDLCVQVFLGSGEVSPPSAIAGARREH